MFSGKTYWIVGASEGLGRALAQSLDAAGARLILSARSEERLTALAAELQSARVVPLDVTDDASVDEAVVAAGTFDGVIYCAGYYEPVDAKVWDRAAERMPAMNSATEPLREAMKAPTPVITGSTAAPAPRSSLYWSWHHSQTLPDMS